MHKSEHTLFTRARSSCKQNTLCTKSLIKLQLSPWCHMDIIFDQCPCYVSGPGNSSVALLSMEGLRAFRFHQKYLNLCSEDERRSYGFGTTWGWIINDRILIFGWTNPLIFIQHTNSTCLSMFELNWNSINLILRFLKSAEDVFFFMLNGQHYFTVILVLHLCIFPLAEAEARNNCQENVSVFVHLHELIATSWWTVLWLPQSGQMRISHKRGLSGWQLIPNKTSRLRNSGPGCWLHN